jgi:adenine-specific DNA-methyltransferase
MKAFLIQGRIPKVIKYLGSKRTLVPMLGAIASAIGAQTAVDLFTGTTRVSQEFKRRGIHVTAVDIASYSEVLGRCFIETDAAAIAPAELEQAVARLGSLAGTPGYVTRTFCEEARYFQPKNGARIDAIRDAIEADYRGTAFYPILLTALLLAADRVDSTTGVQMAYLKSWAPRSYKDLDLRVPELLLGRGDALRTDALEAVGMLPRTELMYLDPPYNQHRYFTNYHVWETLVRWDRPEAYGVARKRIDSRNDATKSVFNRKREMPRAFGELLGRVRADTVVVSYNDEAWITPGQMMTELRDAGHEEVRMLAFDAKRYVGAQIGIHSPAGVKVGTVSHLRNTEYLFVAGERSRVEAAAGAVVETGVLPALTR